MNIDYELKQYEDLKKELQQIYENKGEAAKFRSKCLWVEKGERPTKYFFKNTRSLKLLMRNSLLRINYNENVGKQSKTT